MKTVTLAMENAVEKKKQCHNGSEVGEGISETAGAILIR